MPWYDCDFEINHDIINNLTDLLRDSLARRQRYVGLGQGEFFTSIDLGNLYPKLGSNPDLSATPSRENLPRKNQWEGLPMPSGEKFLEAVEARQVNKGIKAKYNSTSKLKSMIRQLNPGSPILTGSKKPSAGELLAVLLSELKEKGNWIDLPVGKEFKLTKKDLLKIYDRILPAT